MKRCFLFCFSCQEIISIPVFLQPVLHNVAHGLCSNLLLTKPGYSNCSSSLHGDKMSH